jgi:hypothetical protein
MQAFFEAHEALEAAWRDESSPRGDFYHDFLQVVVTLDRTSTTIPGRSKSIIAVKNGYSAGLRFAGDCQSEN